MWPTEKRARPVATGPEVAQSQAENLPGEFRALLRQVGSPASFWNETVNSPPALVPFLEDYLTRLLLPCELPAILTACGHARRGELRELLAQDLHLAACLSTTPFAEPSRRMGWLQLSRLRPLRDDRIVQRYLAAVESGRAHGWHTVVYGVTLAVYSLPLRQGLLFYAQETLSVLATKAEQSRQFGQIELSQILTDLLAKLPAAVEAALAAEADSEFVSHQRAELLPEV